MFTQVELKDVEHLNDVTEVYEHIYSVNEINYSIYYNLLINYSILGPRRPILPILKTTNPEMDETKKYLEDLAEYDSKNSIYTQNQKEYQKIRQHNLAIPFEWVVDTCDMRKVLSQEQIDTLYSHCIDREDGCDAYYTMMDLFDLFKKMQFIE